MYISAFLLDNSWNTCQLLKVDFIHANLVFELLIFGQQKIVIFATLFQANQRLGFVLNRFGKFRLKSYNLETSTYTCFFEKPKNPPVIEQIPVATGSIR